MKVSFTFEINMGFSKDQLFYRIDRLVINSDEFNAVI